MKLNGKKILILCSIPSSGQSIKLWVEEEGGTAFLAGSTGYALWFLKSEKFHGMVIHQDSANQQDVVISDHVKKSREHRNTPMILLQDQSTTESSEAILNHQWAGLITTPLKKQVVIETLVQHTLKARSTRSDHDIRIIKCLVAGFRDLIRTQMNHEPSIGQIRLKPPDQPVCDAMIFKQFSLNDKSGSLCWSLDTMFLTLLAKSLGEESLLEELDPWYIEEFLKKLDRKIMDHCKPLFKSMNLNPEFRKPSYLISPKTQMNHTNRNQVIQVPITHLGSECRLEVSMITNSDLTDSAEDISASELKLPLPENPETKGKSTGPTEALPGETSDHNSNHDDSDLDEILEIE